MKGEELPRVLEIFVHFAEQAKKERDKKRGATTLIAAREKEGQGND